MQKLPIKNKADMENLNYIKCFWKYIDDETPVLLFYEIDSNTRYGTRYIEVFADRHMERYGEEEDFATEAPVLTVQEINNINFDYDEFRAYDIEKAEFEKLWESYLCKYESSLDFPIG